MKTCVKNIGELNGGWSVLFKFAMILIPLGFTFHMALGAWVVTAIISLQNFQTEILTIDPKATETRVAQLELEAARHGWDGDG